MLLAAISGPAMARLEGHARRQAPTTTTVTEMVTITACPCTETSTPVWTTSAIVTPTTTWTPTPSPTPEETTTTPTPTPAPETTTSTSTTSTSTWTPEPVTSQEPTTSSTSTEPASTSAVATTTSSGASADWTSVPADGTFATSGFGAQTTSSGSGDTYIGNVGSPYGSNIIEVDASEAYTYKYVVEFTGSSTDDWEVAIWNKYGKDGKMDGWFERACKTFTIAAGETKYYAFDSDSQGGWAAGKGSVPTNDLGEYASTWGEFDFGSTTNSGWSGFDVSAIVAQDSDMTVQGMRICSKYNSDTCSTITSGASTVTNAYTSAEADEGGIGGNLSAGAVRLAVTLDYSE